MYDDGGGSGHFADGRRGQRARLDAEARLAQCRNVIDIDS
jgi:hypothetical protein